MNKHMAAKDFGGSALKLVAVPAAGDTETYFRLHAMREASHALTRSIDRYLNTPALPACAEYRAQRMASVESDANDMREALKNA